MILKKDTHTKPSAIRDSMSKNCTRTLSIYLVLLYYEQSKKLVTANLSTDKSSMIPRYN